jgi:hypothetical protein
MRRARIDAKPWSPTTPEGWERELEDDIADEFIEERCLDRVPEDGFTAFRLASLRDRAAAARQGGSPSAEETEEDGFALAARRLLEREA